jgi:chemotaxis signal transduction protein
MKKLTDRRSSRERLKAIERSPEETLQLDQERIEAVWSERASWLSRRLGATGGEDTIPVVVLGIGSERYGIDLPDVAEVMAPVLPTPVPGAEVLISGVVNVHGEIRPVIDLKRLLGIETAVNSDLRRVVLLHWQGLEMGLEIDSVEQIRWIGAGDLQSAGNGDSASRYIKGSTKDMLMLLSTEALFAELPRGTTT